MMPVSAATLPAGFTETKLASGLDPTAMEFSPDGRLFICEKKGAIRIVKNGALLPAPFATVAADNYDERGLLGIAFDPNFTANSFVYVYYTAMNPAHNRISRFTAAGDVAAGAEKVILDLDNLSAQGNHNGGALHFGADGKLYLASGNNRNNANSQSMGNLLGKILRLNPDGSIPTDNPFYASATGNNRAIWALGFRNPFTMAIHPATGRMLIDDVGEGTWEEVNEGSAGSNYGWPKAEGHAANAPTGLTGTYRDPILAYGHSGNCAISGGTFFHPAKNKFGKDFDNAFFLADYCGGWIRYLDPAKQNAMKDFATGILRPVDLKTGPDGSLYYLERGARPAGVTGGSIIDNGSTADGQVFRIDGSSPTVVARNPDLPVFQTILPHTERLLLPAGKSQLALFDLSGRMLWEFRGRPAAQAVWIDIPKGLGTGMFRMTAR